MSFNVKSWMKKYYNLSKGNKMFEKQNSSLEFIWVWAIFENMFFLNDDDSLTYKKQLIELASKLEINDDNVNKIYGMFYKRYYSNQILSRFFSNLNLNKGYKNICKEILKKKKPLKVEKLKLILLVIYKFRCNLFHGGKDPLLLNNFEVVFEMINEFLCNVIEENRNTNFISKQ